ncbi:MAG: NADH-quinone oxidoreductase subunit A [Lentimicrobiaceae bacterium]|nr:NADH-quinone oxidoreductase subunit A [Lentimicrobiaceae bacterium]
MESQSLVLFFIVAVVLVGAALLFSGFIPPKSFNSQKFEPYECGIPTIGGAWLQYTVGYYLFAILFLVFDVETVFIYPWAVAVIHGNVVALVEILIFFLILALGLFYAWKKHALKWE